MRFCALSDTKFARICSLCVHLLLAVRGALTCCCCCRSRVQELVFGDRVFNVTFAARQEFLSRRLTNLPEFVFGFCLGMVIVVVVLLSVVAAVQYSKAKAVMQKHHVEEQYRLSILQASKLAHERTIAYASHQLRCVTKSFSANQGEAFSARTLCTASHDSHARTCVPSVSTPRMAV
jgi:hypothetical protein